MNRILIVAALALTAAACGGSSKKTTATGNAAWACDIRGTNATCVEATAPAAALTAAGYDAALCQDPTNGFGGTPVASCPATSRVGRCTITEPNPAGNISFVMHVYSPATAADGAAACAQLGGTWTAG
ncbi:MAG: hypothetical protein HZB56_01140 [Deltaproteobacteria bacterium]|nr:hypothetical protein [Deltaproteobacteria bacterium]